MRYTMRPPVMITSRLEVGVKIGEDSYLSIKPAFIRNGRRHFRYWIDTPTYKYTSDDYSQIRSDLQEALAGVLTYLSVFAEAVQYKDSENIDLFPRELRKWAAENQYHIESLCFDMEEEEGLITEVE